MPAPYNLTNVTNSNNLLGLFQASNDLSGDTFGVMIILMMWIIIFIRLKMYSAKAAMFAASFVTTLLAVMLFLIGMVSQVILMMVIVTLGITFVLQLFDS
jgi:hypothetical protein